MMTIGTVPSWLGGIGLQGIPIPIPLCPTPLEGVDLGQEQIDGIFRTLKRLNNFNIEHPGNPRDLALHRFLLGSVRESSVDALLDYVIALECILLPYDPATRYGDISYRFRLHGAHYLGVSAEGRKNIWKSLRTLYELRSRLVHGADYPEDAEIKESSRIARNLAKEALLKAVHSHFPRVEEFNAWTLGDKT
jgi:hypothetical protein